jgi:DnaJ-class molecular chaperone
MEKSYYEILGVDKKANKEDIKKAFYKKAHAHHPDKNGGDDKIFKEVNEAYQTLSDDNKRAHYDRFGSSSAGAGAGGFSGGFSGQNPFEGFDFSQFGGFGGQGGGVEFDLNDLFGDAFGFRKRKKTRGDDMQTNIIISLEEAYSGVTKKIKTNKKEVDIPIPAGVEDGENYVLKGYGGEEKDLPSGDLYINVRVQKHKTYERDGVNLYTTLNLNLTDVILGKKIELDSLEVKNGKATKIDLDIKELTNPQKTFIVKGKGMKRGSRHGDLIVQIDLQMPKNLSKNARKVLEDLKGEF